MARWVLDGEPVRGGYPPPGLWSLPGVDQARAYAQGLVPLPPIFRLFGIEVTHAWTGTATLRMPASPWLQGLPNTQHIQLLVRAAARLTTLTVQLPGTAQGARHLSINVIRAPQLDMESFTARGQVVMAGPSRATTEVRVEDARGRLVAYATSQSVFGRLDPPPPPAPDLRRIDDPTYAAPDPPKRRLEPDRRAFPMFGDELVRRVEAVIADEEAELQPVLRLIGGRVKRVTEGEAECEVPATEWLCNEYRNAVAIGEVLSSTAGTLAGSSIVRRGRAPLQNSVDYSDVRQLAHSMTPPDGRMLRARASVVYRSETVVIVDSVMLDQEDQPLLLGRMTMTVVDAPELDATHSTAERVLATVLFCDVVDSTPLAERLGDARWREVLQQSVDVIRRAIANENGREVKTEGDGFLATFSSPIHAVRCARTVRDAVRRLGIEIRAGIHLGEVEIIGADIAGIAVHVASRVESAAEPGTTLVTSTVREAMAGSGLRFASRGVHQLKGVSDEWHLYVVEDD